MWNYPDGMTYEDLVYVGQYADPNEWKEKIFEEVADLLWDYYEGLHHAEVFDGKLKMWCEFDGYTVETDFFRLTSEDLCGEVGLSYEEVAERIGKEKLDDEIDAAVEKMILDRAEDFAYFEYKPRVEIDEPY